MFFVADFYDSIVCMNATYTYKIIGGVIVVILLTALYFMFNRNTVPLTTEINQNATTTTTDQSGSIQVTGANGQNYTVTQVPITEGQTPIPTPSLNRPLTVSSGAIIAPEARTVALEKIKITQALLKKDPTNLSAWIDLGIYQKMGGDYEGAILSWKYVSLVGEKPFVSLGNLGNLYAYFLKDMVNAEKYYNQAIKNAPTQIYLYFQLAEAFRDVSKDTVKARVVVDRGLVANPNNPDLLSLKESLK